MDYKRLASDGWMHCIINEGWVDARALNPRFYFAHVGTKSSFLGFKPRGFSALVDAGVGNSPHFWNESPFVTIRQMFQHRFEPRGYQF
jgi:hypothetical protein